MMKIVLYFIFKIKLLKKKIINITIKILFQIKRFNLFKMKQNQKKIKNKIKLKLMNMIKKKKRKAKKI